MPGRIAVAQVASRADPGRARPELAELGGQGPDPEQEALLADSIGVALLVVLATLGPAERVAFVLHDVFDLPFDDIAPVVGRTTLAARQLASRARRRIQRATRAPAADLDLQTEVVRAFLAAAREGDFDGLLALLDPEVVLRADRAAVRAGAPALVRGPEAVARTFVGRARAAQPALVDGAAGLAWAPGGQPRVVFALTIEDGKIVSVELVAGAARLRRLDVTVLER